MAVSLLILGVLILIASPSFAIVHHLFVGNLNAPAFIYSLAFDDVALTFVKTQTMEAYTPHPWIAFDVCLSSFIRCRC